MGTEDVENTPNIERVKASLFEAQKKGSSGIRVALEITGKCTNDCRHCYARGLRTEGDMNINSASVYVDAVAQTGYQEVYVVGGEPMMHKDVAGICKMAKNKGLKVILVTNGNGLWNDDIARNILPVVDEIEISVRSSRPEDHDSFISNRNPGETGSVSGKAVTYEKVIQSLITLNRNNPDGRVGIAVNHDLYKNNYFSGETGMMWEIARHLVQDIGVRLRGFYGQLIDFSGRAEENREYFKSQQIDKKGLLQALGDLGKMKMELGIENVGITDNPVSLGIISSPDELPNKFKDWAEGEIVPAISPTGQVRVNVVDL